MNRKGQGLVEYALVIALLALVSVAALSAMGDEVIRSLYDKIVETLTDAEETISGSESGSGSGSGSGETPPAGDSGAAT